jgi:hypothetical protein
MTEIRNKTANIYTEWLPLIDSLPNEIAGLIFKNILKYQNGEDIKNDFPVWMFIKSKLDEYNEKGKQISEKRKENGKLGGLAKASKCYQELASDGKSSNKIKEKKIKENNNKNIFKKPSLEEVKEYCFERNNNVNPSNFFDFYESKGWKIGKDPMKDWRAAVRNWERREDNYQPRQQTFFTKQEVEKPLPASVSKEEIDYIVDQRKKDAEEDRKRAEEANRRSEWLKAKGYPSVIALMAAGQETYKRVMEEYNKTH